MCLYVLFLTIFPVIVSSVPVQLESRAGNGTDQKYVFAHHMVGNTYPYTVDDWKDDIALASAHGIDAFALNIGSDSWQSNQVKNAYTAAEQSGSNFKMFISFDMTILPCAGPGDAAQLRKYITTYANHTAQFKYNNKVFASTFAGDKCAFGQTNAAQGWQSQFTSQLTGANAVFFVPSFFVDPGQLGDYANTVDGMFNWNAAWPISVTTGVFNRIVMQTGAAVGKLLSSSSSPLMTQISEVVQNFTGSLDSDHQYIDALSKMGNKLYMSSVSPWFFTHYSAQSFNKNFIYLSDQLYPSRWQSVISARDQIPMVEVLTWNDYGESSYVGPIKGAQPNSQQWVDGFNHTAFLDLTQYFISAYKNGTYPPVQADKLYLWARPHAKDAQATSDSIGKPQNADVLEDALFAVVLVTSPAEVTLSTKSTNKTVSVKEGLTQLSLPLKAGDTMSASLSRNNQIAVQLVPNNFTFEGSPQTYNFNAFASFASGTNSN
ncbi:hypothetical protein ACEPAG_8099 [Sanghuangporus baumii]